MIISKTPLRMSFVGGGSDLPSFYARHDGAVVSVTLNKYIYVTVNDKFDEKVRVSYSQTENVESAREVRHPIVRAALEKLGIDGGIEITSIADIPSYGTGLGSSSSYTVGLLNALYTHKNQFSSPERLADEACEIEIDILKDPIGKQDQYAAAYGGFNFIRFYGDGSVSVDPIISGRRTRQLIEESLVLFYTGMTRSASDILKKQKDNTENDERSVGIMKRMVLLAHDLRDELQKDNADAFGEILHENWMLKREMADGISSPVIDGWYEAGLKAGATGGKILGAGGGGFLMFYAPKERHDDIAAALSSLRRVPVSFETQGSRIIFIH